MAIKTINIHAGHNPDGKIACGASGYIKESTEARKVVGYAIELLRKNGITVYDCTCNNGTGQKDVIEKIVAKSRQHSADLDVSVHFNSFNGSATGVEVLYKNNYSIVKSTASRICKKISDKFGIYNRGVKERSNLMYFNKMKGKNTILIECCFCDNKNDTKKYDAKKMAEAIVSGILDKEVTFNNRDQNGKILLVADGEIDKKAAEVIKWKIKEAVICSSSEVKNYPIKKIIGIGGPACKAVECDEKLIGDDRYETMIKAAQFAKNYKN